MLTVLFLFQVYYNLSTEYSFFIMSLNYYPLNIYSYFKLLCYSMDIEEIEGMDAEWLA